MRFSISSTCHLHVFLPLSNGKSIVFSSVGLLLCLPATLRNKGLTDLHGSGNIQESGIFWGCYL